MSSPRLMRASLRALALASLILAALGWSESRLSAQTRPAFFDTPSELVRVGGEGADPSARVPLVIVLPPTGGTSTWMHQRIRAAIPFPQYVAMLTPGRPTRDDYLPRYYNYVTWADERVGADLARAVAEHHVDPERVYLTGFSLGGDTSWALLLRHAERYRGAVVMGSRSSARPRGSALATLQSRSARVAFTMGDADTEVRRRGIAAAHERAQRGGLATRFFSFPGGHETPPAAMLREAFHFVMSPSPAAR